MNRILWQTILALALLAPLTAAASSVARVEIQRHGDVIAHGSLTLVAEDTALASHALMDLGHEWIAITAAGARLQGEVIARDADRDLVLLEIRGLQGEPVILAQEQPEVGRAITSLDAEGTSNRGVLSAAEPDAEHRFRHTAMYDKKAHGVPLLNNCGELIGIGNTPIRGVLTRRPAAPALPLHATSVEGIRAFLEEHGITPEVADERCLSLDEQLERVRTDAEQTEEERRETERLLEEIRQRNEELERAQAEVREHLEAREDELSQTQEEKEALEAMAEEVRRQAENLEQRHAELEAAKQEQEERFQEEQAELHAERERQEQIKHVLIGGVIALLILILLGVILLRRRKALLASEQAKAGRMEQELEAATVTHPDIVLTGTHHDGHPIRMKINGTALIRAADGQILGRDAQAADYVLNLPEISRRHLQLRIRDNRLLVTDLQSSNGTSINGEALSAGGEADLQGGDTLTLGTIELQVHVLNQDVQ